MITTTSIAKFAGACQPKTAQFPIAQATRLSQKYALEAKVHASSHSLLFQAKDRKSKHLRAITHRFALSGAMKRKAKNQAKMLASLRHPGILRMSHFYERPDQTLSVAEFCSGGSLLSALSYIGPFNESLACMVVQQLLDILVYLGREGVLHRNISLKNVLFKRPKLLKHSIRLVDFSYAKRIPGAPTSPKKSLLARGKQRLSSSSELSSASPSPLSSPTRSSRNSPCDSGSIRLLNLIATPPLLRRTQDDQNQIPETTHDPSTTQSTTESDKIAAAILPQGDTQTPLVRTSELTCESQESVSPKRRQSETKLQARVGDIHYMAPEVLGTEGYGLARDIWSVGVLLFMLLTGKAPFDGATEISICKAILTKDIDGIIDAECSHLSREAQDVLRALLSRNPECRPSAREALSFGWFRTNTWTDDSSPFEEEA